MSLGINELFEMLNWNNDEKIQKRGIEEGKKVKHISAFFQTGDKNIWENCAKIIASHSDEELKIYLGKKERYGKIKALRFRSKEYAGWSCGGGVVGTSNGEKKIPYYDFDNYYYSYFLSGDIYRKSCYSCKYANTKRVGDFSLGDYWGVEALELPIRTENGCSLLLVNNERAEKLLESIHDLDRVQTTVEQAARCNKQLNEPSRLPESRQIRIEEFGSMNGQQIQRTYLATHRKTVVKGWLKAIIPYKLKLFVRGRRK